MHLLVNASFHIYGNQVFYGRVNIGMTLAWYYWVARGPYNYTLLESSLSIGHKLFIAIAATTRVLCPRRDHATRLHDPLSTYGYVHTVRSRDKVMNGWMTASCMVI